MFSNIPNIFQIIKRMACIRCPPEIKHKNSLNVKSLITDKFLKFLHTFQTSYISLLVKTCVQLASKKVFPGCSIFLYFPWIILPPSVTFFLLIDIWLWNLVVISTLLHFVCESEVFVLLSSKFDRAKLSLSIRFYN